MDNQVLRLAGSFDLLRRGAAVDATQSYEGYVLPRDRLVKNAYPIFGKRASGAYVWDVDGNRYLDFILAYGTVILGHADPVVSAAVIKEINDGFSITLRKPVQIELAELLAQVVPGAERVLLLKTGSDATSAAVRLSRATTGRERVIRWGYNGWHDWCAIRPAGVPSSTRQLTNTFAYNDLESIRTAFERYPAEVACLLMMPFELEPPAPGFLQAAVDLAHEHGALAVFDEIRTGFRVALGGAQQRYGVRADLVTLSKAMANGYPISAVTGREEVMSAVGNVHIGSTFYINGAEMAASVATISQLQDTDVLRRVEDLGKRFLDGLARQIARSGHKASALGVPQMPFMRFTYANETLQKRAQDAFYTETARQGVLFHPNHHWFICGAMTEEDIDFALDATNIAFRAASDALEGYE